MTLSNRNSLEEQLMLSWQREVSGGIMQHHLNVIPISTGKGYEDIESLKLRAFCHFLLDLLSEEGLDEIKTTLLETIEFYREPQIVSQPYYVGDSFEVEIGEGYESPAFGIAED